MSRLSEILLFLFFGGLLSGCAGFTAKNDSGGKDSELNGIRYYEIAPYLLVYSDGRGNLTSEIRMMPDLSKRMVIDLYAYASSNNSTLVFKDGMLNAAKLETDTTTLPSALLDTIKTLGTASIASAFNSPNVGTTRSLPAPYLFKIVVGAKGTTLVGGQGVGPDNKPLIINVSVTREATSDGSTSVNKGGK